MLLIILLLFVDMKKSTLTELGVTRKHQLSPKAHKIYKIIHDLKATARRLNKTNANNKARIKEAVKHVESEEYLLTKVNSTSAKFIACQLREQHKKNRGRRFTVDDKIFALSLLKQSPKLYKVLRQTFALPSRKTLINVLNKIPFPPGINDAILESLKVAVQHMDPLDRYCCLLFDEMSVDAGLTYMSKGDFIEGFEYTAGQRKKEFATYAMTFMVRGLRKKWKQPVAYFFSARGMSAADLQRNILCIIRGLHNIGLHVVATVCDQHATNVKAIDNLKQKTARDCIRASTENRMFGFSVDGQEVIPIFDLPHLLKGVRNNLLSNNVRFTWHGKCQIASWEDIIKLYELDVGDTDTKMLNKLTDLHVYRDRIKKMKVKYAAQVFSHRVSSTMRGILKFGK